MNWVTGFQLASPFILLLLGWWYSHEIRQRDKAKKDEDALENKERQEIIKSLSETQKALTQAKTDVQGLSTKVDKINDYIDRVDEAMTKVAAINRANGKCTNELAKLVMVLAEGLRDQHLDGNITKAIDEYRKFETDMIGDMLSGKNDIQ